MTPLLKPILKPTSGISFTKRALVAFSLFCLFCSGSINAAPYTVRTIPKNGLNVYWPVLKNHQYFSYKGRNARVVTLASIMAMDCQYIMDQYDTDPTSILEEIELLILTQFALRGVDIQSMEPKVREEAATAEISKRLRQFGRLRETKGFLATPRIIPTVGALCHIVDEHKEDLFRQKFHVQQQWDKHKLALNQASDKDPEYKFGEEEEEDSEDDDSDY